MPIRSLPLATGEFYHVFNRGANRQPTFLGNRDYQRFLSTLTYYQLHHPTLLRFSHFSRLAKQKHQTPAFQLPNPTDKIVNLISYVLMPNHFHFLIQQTADHGITAFLTKLTNSYVRYFNTKHQRTGSLFQGPFKAIRIETTEQLIHISRYIHLHPTTSYLVKDSLLPTYPWSSLPDYLKGQSSLVDLEPVLSNFSSPQTYRQFVLDQAAYTKELKAIYHLLLEE